MTLKILDPQVCADELGRRRSQEARMRRKAADPRLRYVSLTLNSDFLNNSFEHMFVSVVE